MSRIRSSRTGFEQAIFQKIRREGVYFQTHYTKAIGKPDIALPKSRKAVFLHSDFWHGWRFPSWEHILPSKFWKEKIRKNRVRDNKVLRTLRRQGWQVLVLWEHSFLKSPDTAIAKVTKFLKK